MKERRGIGRKWGRNRSLIDANLEGQVGGFISIGHTQYIGMLPLAYTTCIH